MGRRPRGATGSDLHHVMARGNNRARIFHDDADHQGFLTHLGITTRHHGWNVLSYCLMPNHFHLLMESPVDQLSAGMRDLLGGYARRFNRRHGQSGHVFGGRFRSVDVTEDRQVAAVVRYIALNPVEARLCDAPAAWPWSSVGPAMGLTPTPHFLALDRLWEIIGGDSTRGRHMLEALVMPLPPVPGT